MDKMLGTFFSYQYVFITTVFRPDNSLEVGDLIDFTIRPPSLSLFTPQDLKDSKGIYLGFCKGY